MTARTRIGLVAVGGVVLAVAMSAPAGAFTLAETGAALGTADRLAASNGMNASRTRGVVQRRLAGIRAGGGIDLAPYPGGFGRGGSGPCGRPSSARTPSKNWKRAGDPGARMRLTATWKHGGAAPIRMTRVAWVRGADPSRCR